MLAIPIPRSLSPCFAHRSRNQNRKTGHIERRKSHLASALRNKPNYSPRANESKKGGENSLPPFHLCSSITTECLYHTSFPETREINTIIFTRRKKKTVQIVVLSIIPLLFPERKGIPMLCSRMKTVTGRKVSARLGLLDIDEEEMDRSRIDNGREDALVEQEAPHRHLHARSRFLNHCL